MNISSNLTVGYQNLVQERTSLQKLDEKNGLSMRIKNHVNEFPRPTQVFDAH